MKLRKTKESLDRKSMSMLDALWELYPTVGLSLDEILKTKPFDKGHGVVWIKEKGWYIEEKKNESKN